MPVPLRAVPFTVTVGLRLPLQLSVAVTWKQTCCWALLHAFSSTTMFWVGYTTTGAMLSGVALTVRVRLAVLTAPCASVYVALIVWPLLATVSGRVNSK